MSDDRRLIEDLIPVEAINEVAQREKIGHATAHPRKLHMWWARRPLAAARSAVYATLIRAAGTPEDAKSPEFFGALCRWGAGEETIRDARARVLAANGGAPPRVLDMFAGGGAIPLEAARLGCEATAIELNPVAHLIELCMLDYPQRFGASLADDIRAWGGRWVDSTWSRVGHLYPPVNAKTDVSGQLNLEGRDSVAPDRYPIAYLWTRTVRCPNPSLGEHDIPLVRQTWMAKKKNMYVALRPIVDQSTMKIHWEVVKSSSPAGLGFDPAGFSKRGSATCLVCGAGVDTAYVKDQGRAGRIGIAPLAAVVPAASKTGREYLPAGSYALPESAACASVLEELDVEPPDEPIPADDTRNFWTPPYGLTRFRDLFTPRQLAVLCAFSQGIREAHDAMVEEGMERTRAAAVSTYLALTLNRVVDRNTSVAVWTENGQKIQSTHARQALPMAWDFAEANPFGGSLADARDYAMNVADIVASLAPVGSRSEVIRASASELPGLAGTFDAVITDPPYYDNISYSDLSDFFYVWLKRSVGFLYPEHLAGELTPKQREAIVAPYRHGGSKDDAREFYEREMEAAFREAHRVLKPDAPLVCVYAHKTTLGWAALVEALRRAGFTITEAWPLDTEHTKALKSRTASLTSSIFLVARRREGGGTGHHAEVVRDLDAIVSERLDRLTEMGVAGSDLVIAGIGAGLSAFTRYERVERPNGEEVPAELFLEEVQSRVLNAVLARVHGLSNGVGAIDPATRYYVISRFSLGYSQIDFDEANNLARSAGVELDALARGPAPLAEITRGKVRLLDYSDRGAHDELGLVSDEGAGPPLIDVLHGLLWRAGHRRDKLGDYLVQARFDPAKLRAVAQALQGRALRTEGESKPAEAQACERLLGAWKTLVDDNLLIQR